MTREVINIDIVAQENLSKKVGNAEKKLLEMQKSALALRKQLVGLDKATSSFKKLKKSLAQTNVKMSEQRMKVKALKTEYSSLSKRIDDTAAHLTPFQKKLNQGFRESRQPLIQFNGDLLSLMFLGMALQGVFSGALRSIFLGYKSIIPENAKFNRQVTQLTANWEFFKFQLADAFVQSKVFDSLIDGANSLLTWFQELNPEIQKMVVPLLAIGTAAAFLLTWLGIVGLGMASWINLLGKARIGSIFFKNEIGLLRDMFTKFAIAVKNFSFANVIAKFKAFLAGAKGFSLLAFFDNIVKAVKNFFKSFKEKGIIQGLKTLFSGMNTGFITMLKNVWTGIKTVFKKSPLAFIYVAIQTLFEGISEVGDRTFSSTGKKVFSTVVSIIINLIENVVQWFAEFIDLIVNSVAWVLEKAGSLLGFDIDIPKLDLGGLVDGIGDAANSAFLDFMAEKDAATAEKEKEKVVIIQVTDQEEALAMANIDSVTLDFGIPN